MRQQLAAGDDRNKAQQENNLLAANCVLQQILNVQRHVYNFFRSVNVNEQPQQVEGGRRNNKDNDKEEDQQEEKEDQCDRRNRLISEQLLMNGNFKSYQYGATALDLSLMITFQRIVGHSPVVDEILLKKFQVHQGNVSFLTKVTIMDLDPKPFTHAVKYLEQTQSSYQTEWSRRQVNTIRS